MHHISLRIDEPRAADIFAYRGWIFVLTYDCRLLAYSTSELTAELSRRHRARGAVAAYALFSSKGIGASQESKDAWNSFNHSSNISLRFDPPSPIDLGFQSDSLAVMDMHVYYDRIYVATDQGTWAVGIQPDRPDQVISDRRRLTTDATESLSVGMGAVAASLGPNGLAVFFEAWQQDSSRESRVDSESLRSSLGWGRATNYPTDNSYELLEVDRKEHRGRIVLDEVRASKTAPVELSEGTYALWDTGRLLVADGTGVSSRGQVTSHSRQTRVAERRNSRRPLWIGSTGNRLIVTESSNSLEVGRAERVANIYKGPLGSVRTFPGSQRYRRLIAATIEGGFILTAAFVTLRTTTSSDERGRSTCAPELGVRVVSGIATRDQSPLHSCG